MEQQVRAGYYTIKAAIFGHAIGDALGVPVEFVKRERLLCSPVLDMQGFKVHNVPPGTWSDDTAMTLCTLESLTKNGQIVLDDIMERFAWWGYSGYMTPHGKMFGIGRTTFQAIANYHHGKPANVCGGSLERDNGNGSLMRIMPIILYQHFKTAENTSKKYRVKEIHDVSALTHAHMRSMMACGIYGFVMDELLTKNELASIESGLKKAAQFYAGQSEYPAFSRLFQNNFSSLDIFQIKSSGYVIDTLEAAVWCLVTTKSYQECVLKAVNLGGDTDTTAAIAGGLAGVLYGFDSIPKKWVSGLALYERLDAMCLDAAIQWMAK